MSLAWMSLAFFACLESLLPPDTDMTTALLPAMLAFAILGLAARGMALFLAMVPPGFVGLFLIAMNSQAEMVWVPLYLGGLLAIYNLGSGRRLIIPIALSQFLIIVAPIPTLVGHLSWWALPAGSLGLVITSLAALPFERWRC